MTILQTTILRCPNFTTIPAREAANGMDTASHSPGVRDPRGEVPNHSCARRLRRRYEDVVRRRIWNVEISDEQRNSRLLQPRRGGEFCKHFGD